MVQLKRISNEQITVYADEFPKIGFNFNIDDIQNHNHLMTMLNQRIIEFKTQENKKHERDAKFAQLVKDNAGN